MEPSPHLTESLEYCVRHRHSIRFYTPSEVSSQLIRECAALAQLAPSNSNMQNWRLSLAHGATRSRIVSALKSAASESDPKIPPLPEDFKHYRSEFGHLLYGAEGYDIQRDHPEERKKAQLRNFEFFGAPVVGVISMHRDLTPVDAMSVGMFVQTFILALTERGLGTCLEVSVTGYPEVLRREFGLDETQTVLCGIAVGYPAEGNKVNDLVTSRDDVDAQVRIVSE